MTFLGRISENGEFSKKGTTNTFFEISTVQKVSNMIVDTAMKVGYSNGGIYTVDDVMRLIENHVAECNGIRDRENNPPTSTYCES